MSITRFATLYFGACLCVHAMPAEAPTGYTVELKVYVTEERALCEAAWKAALPDHGPAITEMMTMQGGKFEALRCLATYYQKLTAPGTESRGIEVQQP